MPKVYCQKCGSPQSYTLERPNFCQKCGFSLGGKTSQASTEETEETSGFILDLEELEVDIDVGPSRTQTIGGIVESTPQDYQSPDMGVMPNTSKQKKDIMKEFQKEAGSIRKKAKGRGKT